MTWHDKYRSVTVLKISEYGIDSELAGQADEAPGQRDAEEFIEVYRVSVAQLREMLSSTDMLLPSMTASFLALERLQQMGHL